MEPLERCGGSGLARATRRELAENCTDKKMATSVIGGQNFTSGH